MRNKSKKFTKNKKKNYRNPRKISKKNQVGGTHVNSDTPTLVYEVKERLKFFDDKNIQSVEFNDLLDVIQNKYHTFYEYAARIGNKMAMPEYLINGTVSESIKMVYEEEKKNIDIQYFNKTNNENIKSLYDGMQVIMTSTMEQQEKEKKYILENSYLVFSLLHGAIFEVDYTPNYSIVPANTIICFTTPLDYTSSFDVRSTNIYEDILNIKPIQYYGLFKDSILNKKHTLDTQYTYNLESISYNCLADSSWYYQGQVYPNMNLTLEPQDADDFGDFCGVEFIHFLKDQKTLVKREDTKFLNHKKTTESLVSGNSIEYLLSDLVQYKNPNISRKFRLFVVCSCRPIFFQNTKESLNMLKLELITHHMNELIINKISLVSDELYLFKSGCVIQSNFDYLISIKDTHTNKKLYSQKNINLDARMPTIMRVYNSIVNELDYSPSNFLYLSSLNFKYLNAFFQKISNDTIKQPEKKKKFIQILITEGLQYFTNYQKKTLKFLNFFLFNDKSQICIEINNKIQEINNFYSIIGKELYLPQLFYLQNQLDFFQTELTTIQGTKPLNLTHDIIPEIYTIQESANLASMPISVYFLIVKNIEIEVWKSTKKNFKVNKLIITGTYETFFSDDGLNLINNIMKVFPNLKELVFREFYLPKDNPYIKITNLNRTIEVIKLEDTNIIINDYSKLLKLTYLHYTRYTNIKLESSYFLIDKFSKSIKKIILQDCPNLNRYSIFSYGIKLEHLEIINCSTWQELSCFGKNSIKNIIFSEMDISKFDSHFRKNVNFKNLQFNNCKINLLSLETLVKNKNYGLFHFDYKLHNLELNFSNIITPDNITDPKKTLVDILKDATKYIAIVNSFINYDNFIFTANDFKQIGVSKKKKMTLSKTHILSEYRNKHINKI